MKKLPLAKSDFTRMIEEGYIYVDRTKEMYDLINYSSHVFLSRPRRFGKSLLISTLEAMFQGKKELFKGLWIEDKIDWKKYPVLRIDFGKLNYDTLADFKQKMADLLDEIALDYAIVLPSAHYNSKIGELISGIYEKTGKEIVILIDEYDAPIARHITDLDIATKYQDSLRDFYSILKAHNAQIKFMFLTGISKFAKMSIFSVINLMKDVSLLDPFNNVVGFTKTDLELYFGEYIQQFAQKEKLNESEIVEKMTTWYDGYSWDGQNRVFNPYSIVNVLKDLKFKNYWFETGTPSILIKLIKEKYSRERQKAPTIQEFENTQTVALDSSYDLEQGIPLVKLLFETGYLTVKEIEKVVDDELFTLTYPNHEVRTSFNAFILSAFSTDRIDIIQSKGTLMKKALIESDLERFLTLLRSLFAALPYQHRNKASEAYYHGLFYLVLTLLGVKPNLEDATDKGRIDCTLDLGKKIYIIEFKYSEKGTMEHLLKQSMTQIDQLKYYEPFEGSGKEIWLLGVGFLVKEDAKLKKNVLSIEGELKRYS
ncbi:MAG: AAA family ATPase [Chitinophagales bacterium]